MHFVASVCPFVCVIMLSQFIHLSAMKKFINLFQMKINSWMLVFLVEITWGHWPWSRVTIKNQEIKVASILGKLHVSPMDFLLRLSCIFDHTLEKKIVKTWSKSSFAGLPRSLPNADQCWLESWYWSKIPPHADPCLSMPIIAYKCR